MELYGDVAFFNRQSRIALRHNGIIDPESIEEYFHYRGFQALGKVLEKGKPEWVIEQITASKLRGRGGGGFPTGQKWKMGHEATDSVRYLVCNADEGDPGAFMDRSMLESDPLNVIEGMIIEAASPSARTKASSTFAPNTQWPSNASKMQSSGAASGDCWAKTFSAPVSISI